MELEGYGPFRQAYAYTGLAEVGVYAACLLSERNILADDVYMRRPISYLVLAFCNRVSVKS